jgi:hypothetical protein
MNAAVAVPYTSRMSAATPAPKSCISWSIALIGLGLFVFAVVGLSGPGRIDVVHGQAHFEAGRSLVEHHDAVLRDERIQWARSLGGAGRDYHYDRFPLCLVAAGAVWLADATGPLSEGRRHFFFVQCGAVACGLLSILYAVWFRRLGCRPLPALLWAAGGVFCTPMWFYGTSTFDDYLGTTLLIAALVFANLIREVPFGALFGGLLLGIAYSCNRSLASFAILVIALQDNQTLSSGRRLLNAFYVVPGLFGGLVAHLAYEQHKMPASREILLATPTEREMLSFGRHQWTAALALLGSFGAGMIWYFPPLLLCAAGLFAKWRSDRRVAIAALLSSIAFFGLLISQLNFKGDPSWGPRLLTPLFAVLWLFAPHGAERLRRPLIALLLGLGVVVQLLALAVDPHRLYVERDLSYASGQANPNRFFEPGSSHLLNRAREIMEIAHVREPAEAYTPPPSPTFAFPVHDPPHLKERGPEVVTRYRVLNSYRPWWASMTYLPLDERPVPLHRTAAILLAFASAGLLLLGAAASRLDRQ